MLESTNMSEYWIIIQWPLKQNGPATTRYSLSCFWTLRFAWCIVQHTSNSLTQLDVVVTKAGHVFIICTVRRKKYSLVTFGAVAEMIWEWVITEQELGGSDVTGKHAGWRTRFSEGWGHVSLPCLKPICSSRRLLLHSHSWRVYSTCTRSLTDHNVDITHVTPPNLTQDYCCRIVWDKYCFQSYLHRKSFDMAPV